jgi:hypothetical protein
MQHWVTENTGRKYIFVAGGGMSDRAGRNNRKALFAPQSQDRGAARISILARVVPCQSLVPSRINMLLQQRKIFWMQQYHLPACIRPQRIMQRASIHDRRIIDHHARSFRNARMNRGVE